MVNKYERYDNGILVESIPYTTEELEQIAINKQLEQDALLRSVYQKEADPLFFKWQAGEGTKKEWTDKRNEIKANNPKIEE